MWVIFLIGALIAAAAAMILIWAGHKLYLSMRCDNRKFEEENRKENKKMEELS